MGITKYDIQLLLNQTNAIVQKYNEIADISGERFNVFSILGLQSSETRLHSKLINELLNPKGKHGQKDVFLKLFIDVLNDKITSNSDFADKNRSSDVIVDFNTKTASSGIEMHAGKINEDKTEGGRIDIIINDNQGCGIIIENKIWAGDQHNQLLRYHKYGSKKFKFLYIIYLTVDGKHASNLSIGDGKFDYICISYKEDILKWLKLCRKECVQLPIIRETLTQYINQLKIYSGQSIHHMEKEKIFELLLASNENFESAKVISTKFEELRKYYMGKLRLQIIDLTKKIIQNRTDYEYEHNPDFYNGIKWKGGLILRKELWKEKNMIIKFSFDQNNYNELKYGFVREFDSKNNGLIEDIYLNKLREAQLLTEGSKTNDPCPLYFEFAPRNWENNREVWTKIEKGEMAKEFGECLKKLLTIADDLQL